MSEWSAPPRTTLVHIRLSKRLLARIDQKAVQEGMTRQELIKYVLEDIPYWQPPAWRLSKDEMFRRRNPEKPPVQAESDVSDPPKRGT